MEQLSCSSGDVVFHLGVWERCGNVQEMPAAFVAARTYGYAFRRPCRLIVIRDS